MDISKPIPKAKGMDTKTRHVYICDQFVVHKRTILDIAAELDISYQAVHRVLKKCGITRTDGGKSKQASCRKASEAETKPNITFEKYGCTREQWDELRAIDSEYKKTPLAAYHTFKNNFQNLYPDIEYSLSLWDWWILWKESGRWAQRMRNPSGMWVMARIDKALPFNKGNAHIIPFAQLLKETRQIKPRKKVKKEISTEVIPIITTEPELIPQS